MVLFFSATGNSKYCAEQIAAKTADRLVSLNDMMKRGETVIDCDGEQRIGIVAPTYDADLAYAVAEYLNKISWVNYSPNCFCYGVFTCGKSCGYAAETLTDILKTKNISLHAAFAVSLPDNFVMMFPVESKEQQKKHFQEADRILADVISDILEKRSVQKLTSKMPKLIHAFIQRNVIPRQRKVADFTVTDVCIGCGQCERICPMNVISMKDGHPIWIKNECACCLGCLHRCPKQAIQRGKNTKKNGRYVNPNTKLL